MWISYICARQLGKVDVSNKKSLTLLVGLCFQLRKRHLELGLERYTTDTVHFGFNYETSQLLVHQILERPRRIIDYYLRIVSIRSIIGNTLKTRKVSPPLWLILRTCSIICSEILIGKDSTTVKSLTTYHIKECWFPFNVVEVYLNLWTVRPPSWYVFKSTVASSSSLIKNSLLIALCTLRSTWTLKTVFGTWSACLSIVISKTTSAVRDTLDSTINNFSEEAWLALRTVTTVSAVCTV